MSSRNEHNTPASNVIRLVANNGPAKSIPHSDNESNLTRELLDACEAIEKISNFSIREELLHAWRIQVNQYHYQIDNGAYPGGAL